ncbi:Geranylgeranyl pyrophosphate synthase A [Diaporthe amygdali]|uniref:Geranylgeranyl pyrophosphate synthase A n=1 Tax=Phomopsis amygdali TaxID=1214568 RepID=UPI0022FEBE9A|nr:Geranylgeranyl pyrophosphate synthase A [Diaporthe amygdali]KAJ0116069.1 Geranylgeranyl pyrophosphate synthase A [Diaporthe amygdali]
MESPPFHLDMGAARSSVCTELTTMPRPLAKSLQDSIDSNLSIDEGFHSGGEDEDMRRLFCNVLPEVSTAAVDAPFHYTSSLPSKGVRDKLIGGLNIWVGASPKALDSVTSVVVDVHNLSLMQDDVEDNSPLRRSRPSTHSIFGIGQTVNSSTYGIVERLARGIAQSIDRSKFRPPLDSPNLNTFGGGVFTDGRWDMLLERRATGAAGLGHKELILSMMQQTGSLQYAVEILSVLFNEIFELVDLIDRRTGKVNKPIRDLLAALEIKKDSQVPR